MILLLFVSLLRPPMVVIVLRFCKKVMDSQRRVTSMNRTCKVSSVGFTTYTSMVLVNSYQHTYSIKLSSSLGD